jgi:carbon storage regulator
MLVLTRKPGEKVVVDGDITITVVTARDGRVRLAIEAPPHVSILRGELADWWDDGAAGLAADARPPASSPPDISVALLPPSIHDPSRVRSWSLQEVAC